MAKFSFELMWIRCDLFQTKSCDTKWCNIIFILSSSSSYLPVKFRKGRVEKSEVRNGRKEFSSLPSHILSYIFYISFLQIMTCDMLVWCVCAAWNHLCCIWWSCFACHRRYWWWWSLDAKLWNEGFIIRQKRKKNHDEVYFHRHSEIFHISNHHFSSFPPDVSHHWCISWCFGSTDTAKISEFHVFWWSLYHSVFSFSRAIYESWWWRSWGSSDRISSA